MLNLVLIDGNSLLNRAFYATKHLTTKSGMPTNAVFGFTKLLLKIIGDIKPDRLIVTFDLKGPTFRHKMYEGYKATRKPMPDDLAVQLGTLKNLLQSMRIAMCEKAGYEADDLIGTLSHKFDDVKSIVITGDRDSYQLIDECTDVYITKTGVSDLLKLNKDNFQAIVGYTPEQVIDMKALMGDSSDNIPGVAGIGEKTALSLITQYGTLDNVYANLESIQPSVRNKLERDRDAAYLSRELATIDRNVDVSVDLDDFAVGIYLVFKDGYLRGGNRGTEGDRANPNYRPLRIRCGQLFRNGSGYSPLCARKVEKCVPSLCGRDGVYPSGARNAVGRRLARD